ncbi:type I phosphomannose isomerase catalytic subunit [Oerskovia sp. M15]
MTSPILRLTPRSSPTTGARGVPCTPAGAGAGRRTARRAVAGRASEGPVVGFGRRRPSASLEDVIRAEPVAMLGQRVLDEYGPGCPTCSRSWQRTGRCPCRSIPRRTWRARGSTGRTGWGPAGRAERSFHDTQHKPEMVVALTRFEGLSGFRRPARILELLEGCGRPGGPYAGRARVAEVCGGLREAFTLALHARTLPDVAADLAVTVADIRARLVAGTTSPRADATVLTLAEQHPGDPGALVSMMLNRVTLEPGSRCTSRGARPRVSRAARSRSCRARTTCSGRPDDQAG